MTVQDLWCMCQKCSGLVHFGGLRCPAGGAHDHSGSGDYSLTMGKSGGQPGWKWCKKCNVLSYSGNGAGPCTAGENHDLDESADYVVIMDYPDAGQQDWKYCNKCQGLNWNGDQSPGACRAGGTHNNKESGNYSLSMDGNAGGDQDQWRCCSKCRLLSYDGQSSCAGGGPHISTGKAVYSLTLNDPSAPGQQDWRWCHRCCGLVYNGDHPGPCPRTGTHDVSPSGNYTIRTTAAAGGDTQGDWQWCKQCQSLWRTYGGSARCPARPLGPHVATDSSTYHIHVA